MTRKAWAATVGVAAPPTQHFAMPRLTPLILTLLVALTAGCSVPSLLITPVSSSPELEETVVEPGRNKRQKIAIVEVEGFLINARAGGGLLGGAEENPVSLLKQQLDAAAADDRVKALVLRVNSPGGSVEASDVMYALVKDFKDKTGKPVIAACQTLAASGGYYVATAADEIHAQPVSLVGSIGVILELPDASALLNKIGVRFQTVKSGPLKDLGSPFDELSDQERAVFQGLVDDFFERFKAVVLASRTISDESTAFDGRIFSGEGALEVGLVDRVCHLPETLARARELARAPGAAVVMYRRPYGYRGSIYASSAELTPRAESADDSERLARAVAAAAAEMPVLGELARAGRPGFYYLWRP